MYSELMLHEQASLYILQIAGRVKTESPIKRYYFLARIHLRVFNEKFVFLFLFHSRDYYKLLLRVSNTFDNL